MPRPARVLPLVLATVWFIALPAVAQMPTADADDEKLLKDAGCKTEAPALLEFFRKRTLAPEDQQRAAQLAGKLGDDQFEIREDASQQLIKLGSLARPYLREAQKSNDAEVKRRATDCLDTIDGGTEAALVVAAAHLLATKALPGSAAVVMNYLHWTPNEDVQEDVTLALLKIVEREGKVDAAIAAAALTDKSPARRGAAALAVGRSGTAEQRKEGRKLLADPEPNVRLRAAQGLIAARDRDAIPTLIELLAKAELAGRAEDLLARIAGDKAPKALLGETAESRRLCREGWETWWKEQGDKVTLQGVEVDPLVYDTSRRALDLATRWMTALTKGDAATVRRLSTYPFSLVSRQDFNAEQLEQWAQVVPPGTLTFKDPRVVNGPAFLKNSNQIELKCVQGVSPRDLCAVYYSFSEGGRNQNQQLYVIVSFKSGKARVHGLGLDLK